MFFLSLGNKKGRLHAKMGAAEIHNSSLNIPSLACCARVNRIY